MFLIVKIILSTTVTLKKIISYLPCYQTTKYSFSHLLQSLSKLHIYAILSQKIDFLCSLIGSGTQKITRRNEIILAITLLIGVIAIVFVYFFQHFEST